MASSRSRFCQIAEPSLRCTDAPRLALVLIDADPAFLPWPNIAIAVPLGHIGY